MPIPIGPAQDPNILPVPAAAEIPVPTAAPTPNPVVDPDIALDPIIPSPFALYSDSGISLGNISVPYEIVPVLLLLDPPQ